MKWQQRKITLVVVRLKTYSKKASAVKRKKSDSDDSNTNSVGVKKSKLNVSANGQNGSASSTPKTNGIKEPFRRVQSENIEIKNPGLRDNSYKAFDTWGAKANKDLIVTQGKSFRHEKTKKKRGSYRGGEINTG